MTNRYGALTAPTRGMTGIVVFIGLFFFIIGKCNGGFRGTAKGDSSESLFPIWERGGEEVVLTVVKMLIATSLRP